MAHCRKAQLTVFLTNRCNLDCLYCYIEKDNPPNQIAVPIDFDFVKRGISDFFARYQSREIRFFARGEPTLEFSLMKKIKDWVTRETKSDCRFELQTNGFFSPSITEWIGRNIDIVWVSCDGTPEVHNYYRRTFGGRPSADIVEKNIRYLAKRPIVLGCRATITQKNVDKQCEQIDYFSSLGVKVVMADPMFAPVNGNRDDNLTKHSPDPMEFANHFLEARRHAQSKGIFYGSIYTANFDEETEYACRACVPYPHLTTDGYVTACDMAYDGQSPNMSDLVYGKYLTGEDRIEYDSKKIEKIQSRKSSNMLHCQNCEVLKYCAGACLGESLNETGSMFGTKPEVCRAIRYLAKRMPLGQGLYPYLHP